VERPKLTYETVTETVYVLVPKTSVPQELIPRVYATKEAAREAYRPGEGYHSPEPAPLERQSLRPIYGGGTLIENLWSEMDRLMEGLMTGQEAEGDRFRAEELAYVLAIVTNAYDPSIDRIRKEAMERWTAAQEEGQ
jgi:hypothetical protein